MQRTKPFNAILGVAGLLASGLVLAPGSAQAVQPVTGTATGAIEVWGHDVNNGVPTRNSYSADPYTAVSIGTLGSFALTDAGFIRRLSGDTPLLNIPTDLTDVPVKAISATQSSKAAAVKSDGSVEVWGDTRGISPQTLPVSTLGAKAVDVAMAPTMLVILLEDGRVGMLAAGIDYEIVQIEAGVDLQDAVQINVNNGDGFARLDGGGVVGWSTSGPYTGYPADVSGDDLEDPVADFAVSGLGAVALTEAGEIHVWDSNTGAPNNDPAAQFPTSTVDGDVIDVAATSNYFGARTDSGEVAVWGQNPEFPGHASYTTIPEEVADKNIIALEGGGENFSAIVAPPASDVTIATPAALSAPDPRVYDTLTGTPATFNGSPSPVVTNRWLANDEPIAGATGTTLTLTPALLGKTIIFQTIATRGDEAPVFSTTSATAPVGAAVPKPSTTTLTSPSRVYGQGGTATVAVSNTVGRPVTGTVTLKGAGPNQTKTLVNGKAAFALPKSLTPKAYTLTASYSGSSLLNVSTKTSRFSVARAKSKAPTFKKTKTPTSKKSGKASVTVSTLSGLAKASGKVTVTLKKGSSSKKVSGTLSGGKRSIKLPKLKKGTWKVTVSYAGDKNYVAQKSKTYTLKIKK